MQPHEKMNRIAENAHNEATGRKGLIRVVCVGVLVIASAYAFDLGVLSLFVRAFVDMFLAISDVFTEGKRVNVLVIGVIALGLFLAYQWSMINRADSRHHFFGGHDDHPPKH